MAENQVLKYLVTHDMDELDREIVNALADRIVPQLRSLVSEAARDIAQRHASRSPFAQSAAERLIISELVGFLGLTDLDSTEDAVMPEQMTARHVRWWLTSDSE